jgi:hypothetical protein
VQVVPAHAPLSYVRAVKPLAWLVDNPLSRLGLNFAAWFNINFLERTFGESLMAVFDHWLGQYVIDMVLIIVLIERNYSVHVSTN